MKSKETLCNTLLYTLLLKKEMRSRDKRKVEKKESKKEKKRFFFFFSTKILKFPDHIASLKSGYYTYTHNSNEELYIAKQIIYYLTNFRGKVARRRQRNRRKRTWKDTHLADPFILLLSLFLWFTLYTSRNCSKEKKRQAFCCICSHVYWSSFCIFLFKFKCSTIVGLYYSCSNLGKGSGV